MLTLEKAKELNDSMVKEDHLRIHALNVMAAMGAKGFMKRFKDKRFAAKCDRGIIEDGCSRLGMEVRDVAQICINGMEEHADEIGLAGTEQQA